MYRDNKFIADEDFKDVPFPNKAAAEGSKARGFSACVSQADVLMPLAPLLTVRGDTFTIRAYGESHDANGKVMAEAWCEAVVQRTPEFLDPSNPAETKMGALLPVNEKFGRRFRVVLFRWLSKNEITK